MLWANPEPLEMVTRVLLGQHLATLRAEVREAGVATHVVVLPIPRHACATAWALTHLPPQLRRIHELCEETRLVRARLRLADLVDLLVPAPDLLIVKKAALACGEVVVPLDFLAATPAEMTPAIATCDLAAPL